jgi:hypothetical protein
LQDVRRTEPMPGEIVQNQRYPDGLLRAFVGDNPNPHHVLIEIATYPERRALRQALDDLTLAYLALGHLPELVMLVLRPKGRFRIEGQHAIQSPLRLARLTAEWQPVELWTLSAERFLAEGDVGVMPWVPLMQIDGPPEPVLERGAEGIEREAAPTQRTDLIVISQVMAELRFPGLDMLTFFGGKLAMIESPLLQRVQAERSHNLILAVLKARFKAVPRDVTRPLRKIENEKRLTKLNVLASTCADLDVFRAALQT